MSLEQRNQVVGANSVSRAAELSPHRRRCARCTAAVLMRLHGLQPAVAAALLTSFSPPFAKKKTVARVCLRRASTLLRPLCIFSFVLFREEPVGDSSDSSQDEEGSDELSLGGDGAADAGAEDEAEEEVEAEEEESDDEHEPAGSEKIAARAKKALRELDDAWAPRSVPADALEKAAEAQGVSLERAAMFCKRHRSAVAKRGSGNAAVGHVELRGVRYRR